jgi:hypothetical protein
MLESNSVLEISLVLHRRRFIQVIVSRSRPMVIVGCKGRSGRWLTCLVPRLGLGVVLSYLNVITSIGASPSSLKELLRSARVRMMLESLGRSNLCMSLSWSGSKTWMSL